MWKNPTVLLFIGVSSLLGVTEGILRPKGQEVEQKVPLGQFSESDRRQSSIFPVSNGPPSPSSSGSVPVPSMELLPPLVSPPGPVVNSGQPVENQRQPSPPSPPQQEKLELLPPVEIPPERPIDDIQQQAGPSGPSTFFGNAGGVINEVAPPIVNNQLSSSSFIPTTRPGNSGGSLSNRIPPPLRPSQDGQHQFPPLPAVQNQNQNFNNNVKQQSQSSSTPDPGLDCLGRCECPPDFNFVCGNNRYLYQNDCALECDKQCHPGLLKVSMDQCSRKR